MNKKTRMVLIKIGYVWPHVSPEKDGEVMKMRCKFTLGEDINNEKMKMGEKITLVLFHEPWKKN